MAPPWRRRLLLAAAAAAAQLVITAEAATSTTKITARTPTSVSINDAVQITFTGAATGDKGDYVASGTCAGHVPSADIGSGSATYTLTATGDYDLCARASGETDEAVQTGMTVAVVAATSTSKIDTISPTSISESWASSITLSHSGGGGPGSGDIADFAVTGNCGSTSLSTDVGSGSADFTYGTPGTYDLCYRDNGGSDTKVQSGVALTVVASTAANRISAISPVALQVSAAGTITFTGSGYPKSGDKASFALAGQCSSASPSTDPSSGSASFTLNSIGTYDLCYRDTGGSDSIKQTTSGITMEVTATDPGQISTLTPAAITVNTAVSIRFTGAIAGDNADFATTGNCNTLSPGTGVGTDESGDFTITSTGTYDACFKGNGNSDSVPQYKVSLSVTPKTVATKISALDPSSITVNHASTVAFTGYATGDLAKFVLTATPTNCGSNTPDTDVGGGSGSFTLGSEGTYDLCYRTSGNVDSEKETSVSFTVVAATSSSQISAVSPAGIARNVATQITFTGANDNDKATFAAAGTCASTSNAFTTISSGVATFTITATGNWDLCYRAVGGTDSIKQDPTLLVVTDTNPLQITALAPTVLTHSLSTKTITVDVATTIVFTGYDTGDKADFVLQSAGCGSITVSTVMGSGSASYTLSATGNYYLCYYDSAAASAESVRQTLVSLTVVAQTEATKIGAMDPVSISQNWNTALTLTGFASGDYARYEITTGDCGNSAPNVDVSSGTGTFNLATIGNYDLCYRTVGSIDSVRQTALGTLAVIATTSATSVSAITPVSITQNTASTITFTGANAGEKATFALSGQCASASPDTDVGGGTGSFTYATTGTYDLCYRANGGSDSIKQTTSGVSLEVVPPTSAEVVTQINPNWMYVGNPTDVTFLGGHQSGDWADFALEGQCNTILPSSDVSAGKIYSVTLTQTGIYDICFRQAGRTDSIKQTLNLIKLSVIAGAGFGADPVAVYNGVKREFTLPPLVLTPLISAPEMVLYGSTFEGGGPWEQWFGRMVIASKDSDHWMQIAVRKDLLEFNRTGRGGQGGPFESLEVTSGHGDFDNPRKLVEVRGRVFDVPFEFAKGHMIFRRMQRSHPLKFPTIGRARRECMDFAGRSLHFYACTTPAEEYFGKQRDLSIKYAHLDLVVVEIRDSSVVEGLLPELWGWRPASAEFSGLANVSDAEGGGASIAAGASNLSKGAAWAGGESVEDLQKSCGVAEGDPVVLSV